MNILDLKVGDRFYLFDKNIYWYDGHGELIECEVVRKYYKTKKYLSAKLIQFVDCESGNETIDSIEKITIDMQEDIYRTLEDALNYKKQQIEYYKIARKAYCSNNGFDADYDVDYYKYGEFITTNQNPYCPDCLWAFSNNETCERCTLFDETDYCRNTALNMPYCFGRFEDEDEEDKDDCEYCEYRNMCDPDYAEIPEEWYEHIEHCWEK